MIYKWKPRVSIPVDPQVAGEELSRLTEANGGVVQAADIVKAAKPKRSPLHPAFEWDDKEAAKAHRENQARHLLRSIVVVHEEGDEEHEEVTVRAFVHSESEAGYLTIYRVMKDDTLRGEILARAWKELEDWRNRYEKLDSLARVFEAIDEETSKRKTG